MTELAGAVARAQLAKLPGVLVDRRRTDHPASGVMPPGGMRELGCRPMSGST
jgi:hypothetical protein